MLQYASSSRNLLVEDTRANVFLYGCPIYQEDGEPKSMLATHVDDMLWATNSGYEDRVQQLLDPYTIKTVESGTFRFCGREVIQHSYFSVSVKCKDTTEKIEPVRYDSKGRKQTDLARDHEIAQLRFGGRFSSLGCKAMQAPAFTRCEQVAIRMWDCHT